MYWIFIVFLIGCASQPEKELMGGWECFVDGQGYQNDLDPVWRYYLWLQMSGDFEAYRSREGTVEKERLVCKGKWKLDGKQLLLAISPPHRIRLIGDFFDLALDEIRLMRQQQADYGNWGSEKDLVIRLNYRLIDSDPEHLVVGPRREFYHTWSVGGS